MSEQTTPDDRPRASSDELNVERELLIESERLGLKGFVDSRDGGYQLSLDGAPSTVHPLKIAPTGLAPEVRSGTWLVLAFATYSPTDVACIATAVEFAAIAGHELRIGLQPFHEEEELAAWCTECTNNESSATPVWVLFVDGKVGNVHRGWLDLEALTDWLDASLTR